MAIDTGLMDRARETGEALLRVYAWTRPTLSFGRHESVRGRFSPATLGAAGVPAVRRPTGGRVLMHDREVTYSVTAPAGDSEPLAKSYRNINAILLRALAALGVQASESPPGAPIRPDDPAGRSCFAAPAGGELIVGDRKLVGSAQLREKGAMLQHGSILVDDDQPRIATLASGPATPPRPAASLRACLGCAPTYDDVRDALLAALVASVTRVTVLDAADASRYAEAYRARFASAEWTWRR
ncbi:MAG TPA: hypothetical protein VHE78_06110 [Gemmatimonadaceae bacterium]|nr:hypothetical protein [Gemmatimonadaceae bacterium]